MFREVDASRCCSCGLGPTEGEGEEFLDQRPDLGAAAEGGSGSAGKESRGIPQPMGMGYIIYMEIIWDIDIIKIYHTLIKIMGVFENWGYR